MTIADESCAFTFNDEHCDHHCDRREHLFDAFACAPAVGTCAHERHCAQRFADGACDRRCNVAECHFDGGDCITSALDLAPNHLLLKVEHTHFRSGLANAHRSEHFRYIARVLSALAHSTLRAVPVPQPPAIEEQVLEADSRQYGYTGSDVTNNKLANLALRLDNTQCISRCLRDVDHLAQFLTLYDVMRKHPELKIRSITGV